MLSVFQRLSNRNFESSKWPIPNVKIIRESDMKPRPVSLRILPIVWLFWVSMISLHSSADDSATIFVRLHSNPFSAPYYIFSETENGSSMTVDLKRGATYIFQRTDSGHAFNIGASWKSGLSAARLSSTSSNDLVDGVGSIQAGQTLTLSIPENFPQNSIKYYCYLHSSMIAAFAVSDPVPDTDLDGRPDDIDLDDDGDTILDSDEIAAGTDPLSRDSDQDGVDDNLDALPLDPLEIFDTDLDGVGNDTDADDDGDGISDVQELLDGTDSLDTTDCNACEPVSGIAYHWKNHSLLSDVSLNLVGGGQNEMTDHTLSNESGYYMFGKKYGGTNSLAISKQIGATESGSVISSADALAALKLSVGINPNEDPDGSGPRLASDVSPYQLIAADINEDGRVTSADALAILKMAVQLTSAQPLRWVFVAEDYDFWDEATESFASSREDIAWDAGAMTFKYPQKRVQNAVGVLVGDVNGSWSAPQGANQLTDSYLTNLIASQGGSLAQWGVTDTGDLGGGDNDTTAPVINLSGDNPQTIQLNGNYLEEGATSDTGENVIIDETDVDTSAVGEYQVFYNVTDAAGNIAIEIVRTVNVVNSSAPVTKHSVLTSIIDTIVIPNHKAVADQSALFASEGGPVASYCGAIGTAGEGAKLDVARGSWKSLMGAIQKTEIHIIGPSAKNNKSLRNRVYFYTPESQLSTCATDVAVVRAHNETNFDVAITSANQRSLSAVEYLLFSENLDHTCRSNVSTVAGWPSLSEAERKAQRCALTQAVASDIAANAAFIHSEWETDRAVFLDPSEIGTYFKLMTDGLFYFEKYSKSSKLGAPLGVDNLCAAELTCPELVESPFSETSIENIKANAQQFHDIFDAGLDSLADQQAGSGVWSSNFKASVVAVIAKIDAMLASSPRVSIKQHVENIVDTDDMAACTNAFANPDSASGSDACSLSGLLKKVTDELKVDFVAYLGVTLPDGVQGDND